MKLFFLTVLALSASAFAAEPAAPANPHAGMKMPAMAAPAVQLTQQGTVLSTISVPSYTYIETMQGKQTVWLAAPTVAVKKGDNIQFDQGMLMSNFHSNTLKRTFASIYFVNRVEVAGKKK